MLVFGSQTIGFPATPCADEAINGGEVLNTQALIAAAKVLKTVEEPPELFRFKCTNHHYKGKMISNALQTEQPMGLSGHRPMQPQLHRIEVGYTHTR
jgi:hypothetical protein